MNSLTDFSNIMTMVPYYIVSAIVLLIAELVITRSYQKNGTFVLKVIKFGLSVLYYSALIILAIHSTLKREYWPLAAYCLAMFYPLAKNRMLKSGRLENNRPQKKAL